MPSALELENAKLKQQLWDWFCMAQSMLLDHKDSRQDYLQFQRFVNGEQTTPPFVEHSESWRICQTCGKL